MSEQRWRSVSSCPLCDGDICDELGQLPGDSYQFGMERIAFPGSGIPLAHCKRCSLCFKRIVPAPNFLAEVITRQIEHIWTLTCDFSVESDLITDAVGDNTGDMLDIGASRGELLARYANHAGRRSALDIVMYPGLADRLKGEFIQGFIDDECIEWSKTPYDLLTAFDVLEHLYHPQTAFRNLAVMVKAGGSIVLETGDAQSSWASRYGVSCWYYACVFEHHVFWDEQSLQYAAGLHGMSIERLLRKRHKYVRTFPPVMMLKLVIKTLLYRLSPSLYYRINGAGFDVQPASPFVKDHLFAVLRRQA